MRITRLYHPVELICGTTTKLENNASSHLIRVLRAKTGTGVILFNGDGCDYYCTTLDANPKKTLLTIQSKEHIYNESNLSITLIQGLSQQDRMEASIQKSVELGVNRIIPVICQRSNNRLAKNKQSKKLDHWRKIIISACEQSGRSIIPEISDINPLSEIASLLDAHVININLTSDAKHSLKDIKLKHQTIQIFIGPEGGLNEDEKIFLKEKKFLDIRFGPRTLRTETAGPAVLSALQILWGDF